jgi:hypothetical protein
VAMLGASSGALRGSGHVWISAEPARTSSRSTGPKLPFLYRPDRLGNEARIGYASAVKATSPGSPSAEGDVQVAMEE